MTVDVPAQVILVLLLGSARAAAWLVIAPPFSSSAVPGQIKALLSVALAMPLLGRSDLQLPSTDTASVVTALVWQVVDRRRARLPVLPDLRRGADGR